MYYNKPTSFSQNSTFDKCKRWWYYSYIKKLPVIQDMSYALAGNVIHKTIEKYYNGDFKAIEETKEFFNQLWIKKKLNSSIIKDKIDSYWLMCLNAIDLNIISTSREFKVFYPDAVGYMDCINTDEDTIIDWKSSTRTEINEEEYEKQLKFYSYIYYRKFDRLPKKTMIAYLKYSGSKGIMEYIPTEKDIMEIEDWHNNIRKEMYDIVVSRKLPEKCESCHHFCPYKNTCFNNESIMKYIFIIIGDIIKVEGMINSIISDQLSKKFSYELKNAYFIKKARPNMNTTVRFWNPINRTIPIGFMKGLTKTLTDYAEYTKKKIIIDIKDTRQFDDTVVNMPIKFVNGKELRNYQSEAVSIFIKEKVGMIEAATGSGKSLIIAEVIRRIGCKTLILVNRVELLKQLKDVIKESLGIEVGQIGGSEDNIKPITIATIQTVYKNFKKYKDYLSSIKVCIMDECHNINNRSYFLTSHYLINTEYRLGLSGTCRRTDGNDMVLEAVNGQIIYKLNSKKLIKEGWLMKPLIIFIKNFMTDEQIIRYEVESKNDLINETEKYFSIYEKFIVNNDYRNQIISQIVKNNIDKKILILVNRLSHGEYLSNLLNVKYLQGNTSKEERDKLMKDFKSNNLNLLIGTLPIFSEGIDVPSLQVLINASGQKSDIKSIQTLGRLLRKNKGKNNCVYYDFIDESRFMRNASNSRKKSFIKEGHDVEIIEPKDLNIS